MSVVSDYSGSGTDLWDLVQQQNRGRGKGKPLRFAVPVSVLPSSPDFNASTEVPADLPDSQVSSISASSIPFAGYPQTGQMAANG